MEKCKLGVIVSWRLVRRIPTHHQVSMILRLATANDDARRHPPARNRRGGPVWPPHRRAPTQGRPYEWRRDVESSYETPRHLNYNPITAIELSRRAGELIEEPQHVPYCACLLPQGKLFVQR